VAGSETDRDLLLGGHAIAGLPTKEFIVLRSSLHHVRCSIVHVQSGVVPTLHPRHTCPIPCPQLPLTTSNLMGRLFTTTPSAYPFHFLSTLARPPKFLLPPEAAKTRWHQGAMKAALPTGTARVPFLLLLLLVVVFLRLSPIPAMTPSSTDKTANSSPTVYAACEMLTTTLPPPGPDTADTMGIAAPAPPATVPPHHTETNTEMETDAANPSTPALTPATRAPVTAPSATPPLAETHHELLRHCSTRLVDPEAAASRATSVEEAAARAAAAEDADEAGAGTTAETVNAVAT
jgi:hypothetical protein